MASTPSRRRIVFELTLKVVAVKDFREFKFWDRAHRLVVRVYEVTRNFPKEELINLTATMRRTATMLGTALVEASIITGERESIPQLQVAINTTGQIEYHVLLSRDLGYIDETIYDELTVEVQELRRQLTTQVTRIRSLR